MKTDKELLEEFCTYSSLVEFIGLLRPKVPSSLQYKFDNIHRILSLSVQVVSCDPYRELDDLLEELEVELR